MRRPFTVGAPARLEAHTDHEPCVSNLSLSCASLLRSRAACWCPRARDAERSLHGCRALSPLSGDSQQRREGAGECSKHTPTHRSEPHQRRQQRTHRSDTSDHKTSNTATHTSMGSSVSAPNERSAVGKRCAAPPARSPALLCCALWVRLCAAGLLAGAMCRMQPLDAEEASGQAQAV